jgi:rhomboid protease GluP
MMKLIGQRMSSSTCAGMERDLSMINNRQPAVQCPRCRRLVSVNAEKCLNCSLPYPGRIANLPILSDLLRGRLSFVDGLMLACFMLFVLSLGLDIRQINMTGFFDLLSPSGEALYRVGMGGAYPVFSAGRWWTLLTATYLHGSLLHIAFNMLWLRQIGHWVEELFGPSRFLMIYTVAGVVGALFSALMGTPFFVGASGSIFGLYGALLYYGRSRGGVFGGALFRQALIWAVIGFAIGLTMSRTDNWGHLGGLAGGLIVSLLLGYEERKRQTLGHHVGALLTLGFIALCFVMVLIHLFL